MSSTVLGRNAVTVNKKYTEYFLPTVLTAMATNIAMIVDSIIAGNLLGQNSLAAINLMSPISQFYFSITILFGLGASSIISFAKGRRDEKQANRVFTSTFIVLIALSVIFIAIQLPLADSISSLLTKDAELKSLLYQYYVPFIIGTPIYLLLMCSIHFVRADARPAFASNIVIVANAVNLGLDFLFMGAFKMGIAGSSIATVTGYAVGFVMMSTHFIMKKSTLHFDFSILRNPVQFFKFLGKMVTIGLSGALGTMLITVKMLFLNTIIQSIGGSAGMVSYSVCSSSQIFMSMFITGASQTMIPIIGVCLGEKDYDGVRYAFRRAARVLAVSSVVIMLFICIEPEPIIKFFGITSPADIANTVPALFASILLVIFSKLLTRPLVKLKDASKEVAEGNFNMRVKESHGITSSTEITELSQSFNTMADYVEDYIEQLKLATQNRDNFIADFTHELKTPLTSVIGYADMLRSYEMEPEQRRECADLIYKEGSRLEALSLNLLNLIVLKNDEIKAVNIRTDIIADDIKKSVLFILKKYGVKLKLNVEKAEVNAEPSLLKTLLYNLIDNACKASESGKPVTLTGYVDSDRYRFCVTDSGCGIAEDDLAKITEPFYMVDKSRSRSMGGAGLGLSICNEIAKLHGSTLEIVSEVGKGTDISFTVSLADNSVESEGFEDEEI